MADDPVQQALEALRQAAAGGAEVTLRPIGVPADFTVERPVDRSGMSARGAEAFADRTVLTTPRYFDGDDLAPASLPGPQIAELQRRLAAAGLIPKGAEYRNGYWDPITHDAYRLLLSESNSTGLTAEQQLRVRQQTDVANQPEYQAPARLRPDPARLRATARSTLGQLLGREPTTAELDRHQATLASFTEDSQAQMLADDKAMFDAEQAGTAAPEVREIDPGARFEEFLRGQYQPEIQMQQGVADLAAGRANLLGNIFNLDQMIEGA